MTTVRNHGVISVFDWTDLASNGSEINTDAQIAAGAQDGYLTQWAEAAKAWGHPFFLRFDWEMNANWFPWSPGLNGNTARDYVAMWRHVHDIFTNVGASNVSWVWCPNVDPNNIMTPLSSLYPGSAYVDWTCADAYNGDIPYWRSFSTLFSNTYNAITGTIAPTKPMIIVEVASTESGGSKSRWITDMLTELPSSFRKVRGFLWFDMSMSGPGGHADWPVESSSTAKAAFSQRISSSLYVPNRYARLNTCPIPPPT
jgi:beta-mannanase